jgi:hypothetical protein
MQLASWQWAQSCLKHVGDSNKNIIEGNVRQVGHLPELEEVRYSYTSVVTPQSYTVSIIQ